MTDKLTALREQAMNKPRIKSNYAIRTPRDGKPYYCAACGLGWAEYMACEEPGCRLESVEQAQARGQAA